MITVKQSKQINNIKNGATSIAIATIEGILAVFFIAIEKSFLIYSFPLILLSSIAMFLILSVYIMTPKMKALTNKNHDFTIQA